MADFIFLVFYYIIGYRKKVVMDNLTLAFPEKTSAERKAIAKKFYRNFIDTFIEMIKMISASNKYILKRVSGNWEVLNELYTTGRSCQIHLGHTFNWEWANLAAAKQMHYTFLGVYMPIASKPMDRLFRKLRSKSGTVLLPATGMKEAMEPWRNKQYALGLVADQAPSNPARSYWFPFFNKLTAFVTGPENGARANNLPVVFVSIEKPRRGYYNLIFQLATDNPSSLPPGELTQNYVRYLEAIIRQSPDMWLWSHRRWKHEWREEYGE